MTSGHSSTAPENRSHRSDAATPIRGAGEMADLIRSKDWSRTPLGPIAAWSETLLTSVNLMLSSPIPMQLLWGPELAVLYNDALRPAFSDKHPHALGRPGRSVWAEVWPLVGSQLEGVLVRGEAVNFRNVLLPLLHNGVPEDTYWDYSYSPIFGSETDANGAAAGVLNIAQNTTEAVLAQQQLRASEARASRILHSIGDAVIVTDGQARVSRMNPVAEGLTGWSLDEARGRPLTEIFRIISEESRQSVESPAEKVKRLGSVVGLANHTILVAKNGAEVHIDDSGAPIRDDTGALTGIVLVFRNVEEKRRTERARLQAEEVLRSERARLLQVFEEAPAFFAVLDGPDHVISMVNPLYLKLVGNRDVLGKPLAEAVPEATEQGYVAILDRIVKTGEPITGNSARFEVEWEPGKPRQVRFVDFVFQPLKQVDGTVSALIVFGVDVTERMQSEEALRRSEETLRKSEERLQLAMEAADLAAWFYDPARRVVGGDEKMGSLFDLTLPEGPSELWLARVHPDDRERIKRDFDSRLPGEPYDTEFRILHGHSVCWVRAKARLVTEAGHSRMVGICEDITHRRRTEDALVESEERLRLAQATGKIASWEWDLATGAFIWDEGSSWTFGRPPSEMLHFTQIMRYLHEEDRARVEEDVKPAVEGWGEYRSEFRVRWPDDSTHWIEAFGTPVFSDKHPNNHKPEKPNKPIRIVGINMDITERKLAEDALIRNEKLAAVGRLAASIAHEINNPLESVTNLLYLANTSGELSQTREYLATADTELRRASAIVNQTLRFHKQATRPTEVTCESLIDSVLIIYESRIVSGGIRVERRRRAGIAVLCFEGEIRQVMTNLVGNAIDAMNPEAGRLLLRSREGTDWRTGRKGMVVTVADTGPGMSPHVAAKAREAFFTTKGMGGTGLGLWISQEIIDRHTGRLVLRSSQRKGHTGTVFALFLPFECATR